MLQDYRLPELENFINKILNPIQNNGIDLTQCYRRFHAVVYYFEYAVGEVHSQETALQDINTEREENAMICGNAIAAYIFMHNCFVLLEYAINGITKTRELSSEIKKIKKSYKFFKNRLKEIRHSIGAHPEGIKSHTDIATKRSMICSDGKIKIGKFILHPRKDLEELRKYLEKIGKLLYEKWSV